MKKLELKFGSIKEMLTKEQMNLISGGDYHCDNGYGGGLPVIADNCCEAQGLCDAAAYSNSFSSMFPNGGDVPCDMDC